MKFHYVPPVDWRFSSSISFVIYTFLPIEFNLVINIDSGDRRKICTLSWIFQVCVQNFTYITNWEQQNLVTTLLNFHFVSKHFQTKKVLQITSIHGVCKLWNKFFWSPYPTLTFSWVIKPTGTQCTRVYVHCELASVFIFHWNSMCFPIKGSVDFTCTVIHIHHACSYWCYTFTYAAHLPCRLKFLPFMPY